MKKFIERWKNRGYEKGEAQKFWIELLQTLGLKNLSQFIFFEQQINGKFIDAIIPSQNILIEQKSFGKNLSDAFIQAKNYDNELPFNKKSRWIICSDFQTFEIHDMNNPKSAPKKIFLQNLTQDDLKFLIDKNFLPLPPEVEISLQAGKIVQKLYDALKKNYLNPNSEESLSSLNKLCVRIVFCLYAESCGVFGDKKIFRNYLNQFQAKNIRVALLRLFKILDTKISERDPYLEEDLKKFPYVNGNLFSEEIEIPNFNDEIKFFLLEYASRNFDWSRISPTIFGAVFESTLNPITRREGGMHYTSIENIHRVIDNLFLNNLHAEFENCKKNRKKLLAFQEKISKLKFFDPACGSGNFLTESYISLRKLENKILEELLQEKILLGDFDNPVKVSINQFFGIEINDFAVAVAKTALWISELQMLQETQKIIHKNLDFLPLKSYANIFEGNALRLDWEKICHEPNFIFGNPPFVGKSFQTSEQKADMKKIFDGVKGYGNLDYVTCWYKKAADFLYLRKVEDDTFCIYEKSEKNNFCAQKISCAFVSTNSIIQGVAVPPLWKYLLSKNIVVNFAHKTFIWNSESTEMAHVHCIIIGFANFHCEQKIIFDGDKKIFAKNINPYLLDAPNIIVEPKNKSSCNVPPMFVGSCPTDGGNLILSEDEKNNLLKKFPQAEKFLKIYLGGEEFLHNKKRFCLWLKDFSPTEIKKFPPIFERVKKVSEFRKNSKKKQTQLRAETPTLFAEDRFISAPKIFVPMISSENRKYIPMDFVYAEIVVNNKALFIANADLFLFGILESSVHMIWTKNFCGRFEMRFSYGATTVYNTFPFPEVGENLRKKISATAEKILDCRKKYFDSTLADLYDPTLMPKDLRDAHKKNDLAVMSAYNFEKNLSEEEILRRLIELHKNLLEK